LIALFVGCAWGQAPATTSSLAIGDAKLAVEIADEPAEREHGLMQRAALATDHGMLFVYPDERLRNFWMKDTALPLSIAYLDAQGRIVRIVDMAPYDLTAVPSIRPAMYALEMTQGWFALHTVQVGQSVTGLPPPSAR
jgi:uncharacterized protein